MPASQNLFEFCCIWQTWCKVIQKSVSGNWSLLKDGWPFLSKFLHLCIVVLMPSHHFLRVCLYCPASPVFRSTLSVCPARTLPLQSFSLSRCQGRVTGRWSWSWWRGQVTRPDTQLWTHTWEFNSDSGSLGSEEAEEFLRETLYFSWTPAFLHGRCCNEYHKGAILIMVLDFLLSKVVQLGQKSKFCGETSVLWLKRLK